MYGALTLPTITTEEVVSNRVKIWTRPIQTKGLDIEKFYLLNSLSQTKKVAFESSYTF